MPGLSTPPSMVLSISNSTFNKLQLISDLRILELFNSVSLKAVFCTNILFDFDRSVNILNVNKLEDISVVNYALYDATFPRKSHATFSLENFIGTLKELAHFCAENVQHGCLNGKKRLFCSQSERTISVDFVTLT